MENKIIKLYIDNLAQANHDKILLQAENEELKQKIQELENKLKEQEEKEESEGKDEV